MSCYYKSQSGQLHSAHSHCGDSLYLLHAPTPPEAYLLPQAIQPRPQPSPTTPAPLPGTCSEAPPSACPGVTDFFLARMR